MTVSLAPLLLSALPILSTLVGGLVVYKWKKDLHPWLSLSGGILLGVAFLDLLPEALEHGGEHGLSVSTVTGTALVAIVFFHLVDKVLSFHAHHYHPDAAPTEACVNDAHRAHGTRAYVRASSMVLHSMLDGIAIGAGFAANAELGLLVTLAVILHAFSDGMSTVTLLISGLGHGHRATLPFLFLNALAPFIGSLIGGWLALSGSLIALLLALLAGFFIFLALSDLLPQAHSGQMRPAVGISLTLAGIVFVMFILQFAHV